MLFHLEFGRDFGVDFGLGSGSVEPGVDVASSEGIPRYLLGVVHTKHTPPYLTGAQLAMHLNGRLKRSGAAVLANPRRRVLNVDFRFGDLKLLALPGQQLGSMCKLTSP